MAIKRLNYFDHQFLLEADFTDEQEYHLEMRRRLTKLLHTHGIAQGLEVAKSADKEVTVSPGIAIDRHGQEMIVETDHPSRVINLSNAAKFPPGANVFITIAYQEQETDPSTATGPAGNRRITELPTVEAVTVAPATDGTVVRLASFKLDNSANVPGNVKDTFDGVRQVVRPRNATAVQAGDLVNDAVLSAAIAEADGTSAQDTNRGAGVKTDHIQDGAVTTAKLAKNSVTAATIADGSVGTNELANAAVNSLKLAENSVTAATIADGSVGTNELANAAVISTKLAANSVTAAAIADGSVGTNELDANVRSHLNSRYFVSGSLNFGAFNALATPRKIKDFMVFSKASAESTMEVTLNSRAQAGGTPPDPLVGAIFQIRIDDNTTTIANEAEVRMTGRIESISIFAVFQGLAAGNHTVSVWGAGFDHPGAPVLIGVKFDPDGSGGRIVVKETF